MKNLSVIRHTGESQKTYVFYPPPPLVPALPFIRTRTGFFVLSYYQRIRNAFPDIYLKVAILIVRKNYLENNNGRPRGVFRASTMVPKKFNGF